VIAGIYKGRLGFCPSGLFLSIKPLHRTTSEDSAAAVLLELIAGTAEWPVQAESQAAGHCRSAL
jgi:hypothetical protein